MHEGMLISNEMQHVYSYSICADNCPTILFAATGHGRFRERQMGLLSDLYSNRRCVNRQSIGAVHAPVLATKIN